MTILIMITQIRIITLPKMIDLRSDTVTTPTPLMREFMSRAVVGDDAYGEDKSVNELQSYCKELFHVEDALFVTSGMLANRLAILTQTSPGDEVITDYSYHIHFFDSAAAASVCHVVLNTCHTANGILTVHDVENALSSKPRYINFAQARLVSIENTVNGHAGKIFPFDEIKKLKMYTEQNNLALHLDGARLFNAHVETHIPLCEYAKYTDTLSVCFSKGLGAPFGSMLMGKKDIIDKARRFRGWLGGGVHQMGFNASAALYALKNHLPCLKKDHALTQLFLSMLKNMSEIDIDREPETNIIQFSIKRLLTTNDIFLELCHQKGLLLFPWLPTKIRAVIHRPLTEQNIVRAAHIIQEVICEINNKRTEKSIYD
jgi:threonine aldolase